jgi:hypothetical protein
MSMTERQRVALTRPQQVDLAILAVLIVIRLVVFVTVQDSAIWLAIILAIAVLAWTIKVAAWMIPLARTQWRSR